VSLKVLVTAPTLAEEAQNILCDGGAQLLFSAESPHEEALASVLAHAGIAGIMMRGSPQLTRRVLAVAKGLRAIVKVGSGLDSVDLVAATEMGIAVMTSGAATADAVAEHTLALMLSLARDLPRLDRSTRAGNWEQRYFKGREFRALTVGIVGYGRIGARVARLVSAFGARIVVHTRMGVPDIPGARLEPDLDRLLAQVDVLTLHGRLTPGTRGLIGRRELAMMKPTAILINTARGALVDEAALVDALANGRLAGAGLDAFTVEPVARGNPLLALPNVIVTSHVSAAAKETVARVASTAAGILTAYLRGEPYDPDSLANPEVIRARTG
jgi:D-3-phosphoglycerate dehydrogenase